MRRAILTVLATLILLIPLSSQSENDSSYEAARRSADLMEKQYNITILIGPECQAATTGSFTLGDQPEGRTPFLKLLGTKNYPYELQLIDEAISIYPSGFFDHFFCDEAPYGLRVLIADQIVYEGKSMAGVTTAEDGYYNIFLAVGMIRESNVHHELWHAIERRILFDNPDAFDLWDEFNPEDFEYSDDYFAMDKWDLASEMNEYFTIGYSTISPEEDRATIIEALIQHDQAWMNNRPGIKRKLDYMLEIVQTVFGNIY